MVDLCISWGVLRGRRSLGEVVLMVPKGHHIEVPWFTLVLHSFPDGYLFFLFFDFEVFQDISLVGVNMTILV